MCELREVTKRFGAVTALDRVTLALEPGQLTAVLGPNGAGKTTAVRLMLGLTRATLGEARLFGGHPGERAARMRTGTMLQVTRMADTITPREHLALFRSYYPRPLEMEAVVVKAGVGAFVDRRFGTLSGGERRRVLFALALCGNPDLLFLDEPTTGLDVDARHLLWNATRDLVKEGRSVLLTTHYLDEADALADRIVVLDRGRIVADGSPADVKRRVAGRRVRCVTSVGVDEIAGVAGVQSVRRDGGGVVALTTDAEELVRTLLGRDPGLSGLEVTGAGLEEAFRALTERRAS